MIYSFIIQWTLKKISDEKFSVEKINTSAIRCEKEVQHFLAWLNNLLFFKISSYIANSIQLYMNMQNMQNMNNNVSLYVIYYSYKHEIHNVFFIIHHISHYRTQLFNIQCTAKCKFDYAIFVSRNRQLSRSNQNKSPNFINYRRKSLVNNEHNTDSNGSYQQSWKNLSSSPKNNCEQQKYHGDGSKKLRIINDEGKRSLDNTKMKNFSKTSYNYYIGNSSVNDKENDLECDPESACELRRKNDPHQKRHHHHHHFGSYNKRTISHKKM